MAHKLGMDGFSGESMFFSPSLSEHLPWMESRSFQHFCKNKDFRFFKPSLVQIEGIYRVF
jgi:hypothetical protein